MIVQQIDQLTDQAIWSLTEDLTHCRTCLYQIICGRQAAGMDAAIIDEDDLPYIPETLTPERP